MSSLPTAANIRSRTVQSAEDLWEEAIKKLDAKHVAALQNSGADRREILEEVLSIVQNAERTAQQKKWKWKNRNGNVIIIRDVFAKMVVWIEKFKAIGDTIIQYDTGHAALPWAAARFLLQIAINDVQTNGAMLEGIELVLNIIARYKVVERLYLQRDSSVQGALSSAVIQIYASVLEFLLEASRYFSQNSAVRLAKSIFQLEDITTKYISKIKRKENDVDKYVRLASGEILDNTAATMSGLAGELSKLELNTRPLPDLISQTIEMRDDLTRDFSSLQGILKDLSEPVSRMATQLSTLEDNLQEAQRLKIFEWLSVVHYMNHHRSKSKALLPRSGQWLLQKPKFLEWMESSSSSILWLHGIPGSGKSMLVARVIDYLHDRNSSHTNPAPIAYFYCARTANEPERSDPAEVLRSILEQLSSSDEDLPIREPVVKEYLSMKKEARGRKLGKLELEDTVRIILHLLESNPATIVIDGLDECDPTRRQDLLNGLRTIIAASDNIVKVFVSSRDDHDLVHRLAHTPNLYINASDNAEDIQNFVLTRVDEAISEEKMLCGKVSTTLRKVVVDSLIRKAEGMFRLVSLHIESLCDPHQIKTESNVLNALDHLPRDLKGSYDTIMSQISNSEEPNPKLARRTLNWLLCSQETLNTQAFIEAICTDMPAILLKIPNILSFCCNLVVYDAETDSFRLAHLSVREYLESLDGYSLEEANSVAAEQCISFLLVHGQSRINHIQFAHRSKHSQFPFHADIYWPRYTQLAGLRRNLGRLGLLLREFLCSKSSKLNPQFVEWTSAKLYRLDETYSWEPFRPLCTSHPANPIFVVCVFDFHEMLAEMIQDKGSPGIFSQTNIRGLNCAEAAAYCNNVTTVSILLEATEQIELAADFWHGVLFRAASNCSFQVMDIILRKFGDNFVTDSDIERIAKNAIFGKGCNERVLKMLFENKGNYHVSKNMIKAAMGNTFDGNMVGHLVKIADHVEITVELVEAALRNLYWSNWYIETLLSARNTIILDAAVARIIKKIGDNDLNKLLLDREETILFSREDVEALVIRLDKKTVHQFWFPGKWTECDVRDFLLGNYSSTIDSDFEIPFFESLISRREKDFDVTWEDLVSATKVENGREFMLELLRMKQLKIADSAVNFIIGHWDLEIIKMLLSGRRVEVNKNVVRAAAGNFKHGAEIVELLLVKELEEEVLG